jgi:hypothetical protein
MSTTDGIRSGAQTIEEIEARADAIKQAENEAMSALAAFLRDLAVTLPPESKLPVRFAEAAKSIDLFGDAAAFWRVEQGIREWNADKVDELIALAQRARRML